MILLERIKNRLCGSTESVLYLIYKLKLINISILIYIHSLKKIGIRKEISNSKVIL